MQLMIKALPIASVFLSTTGRNGYFVGVTWLLASERDGSASVATFLLICALGELLTNGIGGMIVDRTDPRIVCVACDIGRLAAVVSIAAAAYWHVNPQIAAYASVAFYSAFDRTYLNSLQSVISTLPDSGQVGAFVSASYVAMQTGNLIASLSVGWLVATSGEFAGLGFVVACFLASLACMLTLSRTALAAVEFAPERIPAVRSRQANDAGRSSLLTSLGLQYSLIYAMGMLLSVLAASYVLQKLNGSASDYGTIEAAWSLGAIAGGLVSLTNRGNCGRATLPIQMLLSGFALLLLWITTGMVMAAIGMAIAGTCYTLSRVFTEKEILRVAPVRGQGAARGQIHSICLAISLASFTIIVMVDDRVSPEQIIGLFGLTMLTIAMLLLALLPAVGRWLDRGRRT